MKLCFIGGTGHFDSVTGVINNRTDEFEVCGLCPGPGDEDVSHVARALSEAGYKAPLFENCGEMFSRCRPDIAVVACYFGLQARVSADALQRGISVLSDKPLATNSEDLSALRQAYESGGAKLAAMLGGRYEPWFHAARRLVRQGEIGDVRLVNAQKSYRLGLRGAGYTDRSLYGGTIPWVAIHAVDWIYWITGLRYRSVAAAHSRVGNNGHGDLENTTLCLFQMEDEVIASVSADYLRGVAAPRHDDDRIRIMGTRGSLEVRDRRVYVINEKHAYEADLPESAGNLFDDFAASVRGDAPCPISAEDSLYVTGVCLGARDAADSGGTVLL